jgi:hypothetical protein
MDELLKYTMLQSVETLNGNLSIEITAKQKQDTENPNNSVKYPDTMNLFLKKSFIELSELSQARAVLNKTLEFVDKQQ